jgi:hypothetical protein
MAFSGKSDLVRWSLEQIEKVKVKTEKLQGRTGKISA